LAIANTIALSNATLPPILSAGFAATQGIWPGTVPIAREARTGATMTEVAVVVLLVALVDLGLLV
jgi:hypothetical protein